MMGCNCEWSCQCKKYEEARPTIERFAEEVTDLNELYQRLNQAIANQKSDKIVYALYRMIADSKKAIKSYEDELEELL